jgi:class 3 adenylate cyclase
MGDLDESRYITGLIPGAKLVELSGNEHPPFLGDADEVGHEVGTFLAGIRHEEAEFDRSLATVLFTDIVGSTARASELGDRAWADLLERHHAIVRAMLTRYRGNEIDTAGDGFFATFDGPARAVRCAQQIQEALEPTGLEVRAGVHTGEVRAIDGNVGGLGVVIGARVGALAGGSEILVSQTVRDLVAGSGLAFDDAGEHELKGLPETWRLYRVVDVST